MLCKSLKRRVSNPSVPNADGVPEQVVVSLRWSAGTELLTSDAVFETDGRQLTNCGHVVAEHH